MMNKLISTNEDPIMLFTKWYEEAKKSEVNDPNAMNLATISSDNKPSSRIVLLKSYDNDGFVFYTNSLSKKGKSIKNNNNAALNFHWKSINKQIRIEGLVSILHFELTDKYFNSRPLESRIAALTSSQSEYLKDRKELMDKYEDNKKKFSNKNVPRPSHWNGYVVKPYLFEFWQDMPHRLHDRVEFKKFESGWEGRKLYP